jgi:nucleoporin GLE1
MSTLYQSSPITSSPSDSSDLILDSPSRQLLRELRLLQIRDRHSFYERLEEQDRNLAREHNAGLASAAAKHNRIRRDAEEVLRKYHVEVERQRKQEEEERRRKEETIERKRREREEAERRGVEAERARAEEARRTAAEAKAKAEAAERGLLEIKTREEELERQKQESLRKAKEASVAEEAKARAEKEREQNATATPLRPQTAPVSQAEKEAEQKRYLEIHQYLKKFRAFMRDETKKNQALKARMGDMRRAIRKCVGQLTDVKGQNKQPVRITCMGYHMFQNDVTDFLSTDTRDFCTSTRGLRLPRTQH